MCDQFCFLDGTLYWTCVMSSVFLLLRSTGDVMSSVFLTGRCTGQVCSSVFVADTFSG